MICNRDKVMKLNQTLDSIKVDKVRVLKSTPRFKTFKDLETHCLYDFWITILVDDTF